MPLVSAPQVDRRPGASPTGSFDDLVAAAQENFVDAIAIAASAVGTDGGMGQQALRQVRLSQTFFRVQRELLAADADGSLTRDLAAALDAIVAGRATGRPAGQVAARTAVEHVGARRGRRSEQCLRRLVELEDRWAVDSPRPVTAPPTLSVPRTDVDLVVPARAVGDDWSPLSALVPITLAAAVVTAVMAWLG